MDAAAEQPWDLRTIRFPGQYYDEETGLHYNYHRYYDPSIGRYISADPIGQLGGVNLYAYVSNDPINAIDPLGLLNPVKGAVGATNVIVGVASTATGARIGHAAAAFGESGEPAAPGIGAVGKAYAGYKVGTGLSRIRRGLKQLDEAQSEDLSDANAKNLLGLLPSGQKFDDRCEPSLGEYAAGLHNDFVSDPASAAVRAVKDYFVVE